VSTYIKQYKAVSTYIKQYKAVSTYIKQHKAVSTYIKQYKGGMTKRPTCIFTMGRMNKRLSKAKHTDGVAYFINSYIWADKSIVTVQGDDTMSSS
jgi:menaquinone-dependent protoporphyrinogen IX oxidase